MAILYCILHSGDFLNVVPCSAVCRRLDDTSLRPCFRTSDSAPSYAPPRVLVHVQVDSDPAHDHGHPMHPTRVLVHVQVDSDPAHDHGHQMCGNAVDDVIKRALRGVLQCAVFVAA